MNIGNTMVVDHEVFVKNVQVNNPDGDSKKNVEVVSKNVKHYHT